MAKLYYNGVLLPEIPADLLSSYPYRWISVKGSIYNLMLSPYPWYRKNENLYTQTSTYVWYQTTETADSWGFHKTFTDEGAFNYASNLVWANHDIPDGSATATEIYFEGSEPLSEFPEEPEEPEAPETQYAERYSILGSILVGTARQIMRLTDSTTKVKPEEFEPKLEGINIQLQELTVTATEEVQTITPPSGVYGFSKVIVEAVEDSGGAGSGGEGDDAGDTSDTLLVESSKNFGYEWNYATSLYNGVLLPNPINWPYLLVYNTSTTYYINGANAPFVLDNGSLKTSDGSRCAVGTVTRKTALDANALSSVSWNMTFSESGYATKGKTLAVANHEVINKSNGSTYISPTGEIVASGEGVFAALPSDARYIVKKTTLDRLAFHIQKKMGTSAKLSVVDIDAYLDGL